MGARKGDLVILASKPKDSRGMPSICLEVFGYMSQRWIIYVQDQPHGPWTAQQIREELRAGRIDPFDFVCQEGSTVKRALVEVDEIFQSTRVQLAEIVAEAAGAESFKSEHLQNTALAGQQNSSPVLQPPVQAPSNSGSANRPTSFVALAASEGRLSVHPGEAQKNIRNNQYFVASPTGQMLGPITSSEVMAQWLRGALDPRASVQRVGDPKRIPIKRFVLFYERTHPGTLTKGYGPRQRIQEAYVHAARGMDAVTVMLWGIVISLVLGGAGYGFWLFTQRQVSEETQKAKQGIKPLFDLKANNDWTKATDTKMQSAIGNQPVPGAAASPQPSANSLPVSSVEPLTAHSEIVAAAAKPVQKPARQHETKRHKQVSRTPIVHHYQPVNVNPAPPQTAMKAQPASVPQRVSPPPAAPKNAPRPAVDSKTPALKDGANVQLKGYRFASAALDSCEGKCKIPMTGSAGPITAVFFKEAFGQLLTGKASGVSISGTVRKDPVTGKVQIIVRSFQ